MPSVHCPATAIAVPHNGQTALLAHLVRPDRLANPGSREAQDCKDSREHLANLLLRARPRTSRAHAARLARPAAPEDRDRPDSKEPPASLVRPLRAEDRDRLARPDPKDSLASQDAAEHPANPDSLEITLLFITPFLARGELPVRLANPEAPAAKANPDRPEARDRLGPLVRLVCPACLATSVSLDSPGHPVNRARTAATARARPALPRWHSKRKWRRSKKHKRKVKGKREHKAKDTQKGILKR